MPGSGALRPDDETRLAEIVEVVVGIASKDFSRRAKVRDGLDLLDGLATGVNMLAEEVEGQEERERAAQQRLLQTERLAALGQLAAGVAHEINNPAAFVHLNLLALVTLLQQMRADGPGAPGALVDQALEIVDECRRGIERVSAIVRDLRGFARSEEPRFEAIEPDSLVDEACKMIRAELAYRARLVVRRGAAPRIRGDRRTLVQVLTNLLLNAAHAIPEGALDRHAVTVGIDRREDDAVITIADTGAGIDPALRDRIFEPFFSTKPGESGLGLGLALCADIVRRHAGTLSLVHSSPAGSTFELRLPAATLDDDVRVPGGEGTSALTPPPGPATGAPAPRLRVLLIDDEEALLAAWRRLFANTYDLATVSSGTAATALLAQGGPWDAVLCDLMMPGLDGPGVFEWVRQHRPELVDRMLFTSGGAFTPRGAAFSERMGDRILQKPVAPDALRQAVDRLCER